MVDDALAESSASTPESGGENVNAPVVDLPTIQEEEEVVEKEILKQAIRKQKRKKQVAQHLGSPITMILTPTGQGITEHPLITGEETPIEKPNVTAEVQSSEEAEKELVPNLQVEDQSIVQQAFLDHTESELQALTDQAGIQVLAPTTDTEKKDVPKVSDAQEDSNKEI
ncbi:hypothetical protein Dimus_033725 [Dionaea muscipula]